MLDRIDYMQYNLRVYEQSQDTSSPCTYKNNKFIIQIGIEVEDCYKQYIFVVFGSNKENL